MDGEGEEVPAGEEGQIAVRVKPERPLGLFQEYWRDSDAMESSFRGDWYLTGDKAYKDEDEKRKEGSGDEANKEGAGRRRRGNRVQQLGQCVQSVHAI